MPWDIPISPRTAIFLRVEREPQEPEDAGLEPDDQATQSNQATEDTIGVAAESEEDQQAPRAPTYQELQGDWSAELAQIWGLVPLDSSR